FRRVLFRSEGVLQGGFLGGGDREVVGVFHADPGLDVVTVHVAVGGHPFGGVLVPLFAVARRCGQPQLGGGHVVGEVGAFVGGPVGGPGRPRLAERYEVVDADVGRVVVDPRVVEGAPPAAGGGLAVVVGDDVVSVAFEDDLAGGAWAVHHVPVGKEASVVAVLGSLGPDGEGVQLGSGLRFAGDVRWHDVVGRCGAGPAQDADDGGGQHRGRCAKEGSGDKGGLHLWAPHERVEETDPTTAKHTGVNAPAPTEEICVDLRRPGSTTFHLCCAGCINF